MVGMLQAEEIEKLRTLLSQTGVPSRVVEAEARSKEAAAKAVEERKKNDKAALECLFAEHTR